MDTDQPNAVMTVSEVATYLKVAPSTVYKLARAGELPGRKVGGTWRFSREGIEGWLRKRPLGTSSSESYSTTVGHIGIFAQNLK